MSLTQIEYFVAVAEEGHVGRASRRMHVSQPPMSRQIRALEDELGVTLFDRTPRGMVLRDEGRRFLARARRVLEELHEARREARDPAAED